MNYVKLIKYSGSNTVLNIKNNIPYITFPALSKYSWLNHGFSTKLGGVSENELYSLNLGINRGDKPENVIKNHEIISDAIGFDSHKIVTGNQTHTTNIKIVSKDDIGKGLYKDRDYSDIDGLITNEKGIVLTTYYADCVPLFIVDTRNKAIGLSHSGWKGTVGKIGKHTIDKMVELYGTNPKDLVACIGPSICMDCYEISEDVATIFEKEYSEYKEEILLNKGNGKYQLNLWKCNEIVFKEAGVDPNNIVVTDICTCCNPQTMFSHRAHKGKRGNLAAFLTLV